MDREARQRLSDLHREMLDQIGEEEGVRLEGSAAFGPHGEDEPPIAISVTVQRPGRQGRVKLTLQPENNIGVVSKHPDNVEGPSIEGHYWINLDDAFRVDWTPFPGEPGSTDLLQPVDPYQYDTAEQAAGEFVRRLRQRLDSMGSGPF